MIAAPAELKLSDGVDTIYLRPANPSLQSPVICKQWDPGAPSVREVTSPMTGADGSVDGTYYSGPRTVVLDLQVFGNRFETPYQTAERLTAMTHPTRRPSLFVTRGAGDEWELELRGADFNLTYGRKAAAMLELQLTFTAPKGMFESKLPRTAKGSATAAPSVGQIWPPTAPQFTFPENWGSSGASEGPLIAQVRSSVPVEPMLYMYGPCTGAAANLDTGEVFAMKSTYTIPDGRLVYVDMRNGTVVLDGGQNLINQVDWNRSTFWRLPAYGDVGVYFTGTGGRLELQWRDRRLTA
jgi:hypothetical protein